jgi:hypothetical protein
MADTTALVNGIKNFLGKDTSAPPKIESTDFVIEERGNLAPGKPTDFYGRVTGESSTSKYIQANTTDPDGKPVAQSDRVDSTPAIKVQQPQLKTDTQKLDLMKGNFLSKLLGIPFPLPITPHSHEIKEAAPTDHKAKYGKIQIKENSAGFVEIRDETPGNVRKVDLHPTGTYQSMLDNGDVHEKVTGKKFTYVDKNWEVIVFGDEISVISGSETINIKKDRVENINGQRTVNVDKDSFSKVSGNHTQEVVKDYDTRIGGNEGRKVVGDQKETIDGNNTRKVGKSVFETVSGNQTQAVGGNLQIAVSGNITIVAAGRIIVRAPKVMVN